ncbi:MAG: glucuronate isomerase [Oscillospiraceae bacterium]|jgi:glucuronate isomerase|nr:glucuronate isomerase [Oscillospiraceae bacterium]
MTEFLSENFLLTTDTARKLYFDYAAELPIIDFHCHIDPREIYEDKRFTDLADAWLTGDHYKWRLMRICGVDERFITGDAPNYEKIQRFAEILPRCVGNPVYHWTHLELRRYFDCDLPLNADTAAEIWQHCNACMPSVREILEKSRVETIITTDTPDSDLSWHRKLAEDAPLKTRVLPGMRFDGQPSGDTASRVAFFADNGCRSADIGTDDFDAIRRIAPKIAAQNWVMELHLGALRNVNTKIFRAVGANTGFDAMGGGVDVRGLAKLLDDLNTAGALPKTLIFPLNPNDNAAVNALAGAFPNVYQGAAWWFNDSIDGMTSQLRAFANVGVLANFTGMLTDSRSFLSYTRHEYFRRLLCDWLGGFVERGEYPADFGALRTVVRDMCHDNAARFFGVEAGV